MLEGIKEALRKFVRSSSDYEVAVKNFIRDLQRELIKSDVNVKLVIKLSNKIKERALKEKPPPGVSRREWFVKVVYEELSELFGGDKEPEVKPPKIPYVIMLVGVQGSGKTTTAGKLAYFYKKRGYKVALIAADTYRPGAYDQLKQLAEKVGVLFYGEPNNKDAVEIAKKGVRWAIEKGAEIIIVDTAGRHKEEKALLDEMERIAKEINPDEVMLVLDAAIGQQAKALAEAFHSRTPIGSIIITKLDGTAKGGGALSAVAVTGATVKFVGTGEKVDEIEVFNPRKFVARMLGLGDLESLLAKFRELEEAKELEKRSEEILRKGDLTLRDLYHQIISLRKMGPLSKILQMLPGVSMWISDDKLKISEEKMDKWLAILNSMTYEELDKPEIIDKSRIRRIAIGSGTSPHDVEELLNYYKLMKKMIRNIKRQKRLLQMFGKKGF